jgi:hypothetical protein
MQPHSQALLSIKKGLGARMYNHSSMEMAVLELNKLRAQLEALQVS